MQPPRLTSLLTRTVVGTYFLGFAALLVTLVAQLEFTKSRLLWLFVSSRWPGWGSRPLRATNSSASRWLRRSPAVSSPSAPPGNHVYERDRDRRMSRTSDRATVRSSHASNAYLGFLLAAVVVETVGF